MGNVKLIVLKHDFIIFVIVFSLFSLSLTSASLSEKHLSNLCKNTTYLPNTKQIPTKNYQNMSIF